ncbi:MAG: hypothetical protein HZA54_05125 [Planctomycetes bacterium]|nr:hypothetical protein [Planctomycetota bacterium]
MPHLTRLPALPALLLFSCALLTLLPAARLAAEDEGDGGFLGIHEAELRLATDDGAVDALLSGVLDLEGYVLQEEGPGLLFADHSFVNPRLTLFLDANLGEHLFLFVQARADRGFDPSDQPAEIRPDEYFGRYTLSGESWSAALQLGKFATPVGNFVPRHDSFRNGLVRAPLLYDAMTTVGDDKAPPGNQAQLNRWDLEDKKTLWQPMIWGPVYATGAQLFGTVGVFDWRVAVTNAAPGERPDEWEWKAGDEQAPAWAVRLGAAPLPGLVVGLNYAWGPYLRDRAEASLVAGRDRSDYDQRLAGIDLAYAVGHLEFWAEAYVSTWEVAKVRGDLDVIGYYIEAKYTLTPRLHASARWNQMLFGAIEDAAGRERAWDRDAWRVEVGAGYLLAANLLAKVQYEWNVREGRDPEDDVLSLSLSLSF